MSREIGLAKGICSLLEDQLSDYTIEVENREFKVHKLVMASVSDYFNVMLTGGMVESQTDRVRLEGLDPLAVSNMIDFIYTGQFGSTETSTEELLSCAVYLQIPSAIEECTKLLINKVSTVNCFEMLSTFQNYNAENGVEQATQYIKSNIEDIMRACVPLELSDAGFFNFVRFWKNSEWDLVSIVRDWVHLDYENHKQFLDKLMSHVRFGLLTPEQLEAIKQMDIYSESDSAWHDLIDKAEEYHNLPTHQKVLVDSEQSRVRSESVPICYTANDTSSSVFYSLRDGKSWKQHEARLAPDLCNTGVCAHLTVNNYLIVCEEYDNSPTTNQRWHIFDARTLTWSAMASMQIPKVTFALVYHDKYLYAIGGRTGPPFEQHPILTDDIEQYDFETNTWTVIPSKLPVPLEKHSAFVINGLIYVCGGSTSSPSRFLPRVDCLDLSTGTWLGKASMPSPCFAQQKNVMELEGEEVIFVLDDYYDMYIYSPSADLWSKWEDCWSDADSGINRECSGYVIVDRNRVYIYGFISTDDDRGDFNGFVKWTVRKMRKPISEVRLDNYPAEQLLYPESQWVSLAAFLSIPPQF